MGRFYITIILIALLVQQNVSNRQKESSRTRSRDKAVQEAMEPINDELEEIENVIINPPIDTPLPPDVLDKPVEISNESYESEIHKFITPIIEAIIKIPSENNEGSFIQHLTYIYQNVFETFLTNPALTPKQLRNFIQNKYSTDKEKFIKTRDEIVRLIQNCGKENVSKFFKKLNEITNSTSGIVCKKNGKKLGLAYETIESIIGDPEFATIIDNVLVNHKEGEEGPLTDMFSHSFSFLKTIFHFLFTTIGHIIYKARLTNDEFAKNVIYGLEFVIRIFETSDKAFNFLSEVIDPVTNITLGAHFEGIKRVLSNYKLIEEICKMFAKEFGFASDIAKLIVDKVPRSDKEAEVMNEKVPEGSGNEDWHEEIHEEGHEEGEDVKIQEGGGQEELQADGGDEEIGEGFGQEVEGQEELQTDGGDEEMSEENKKSIKPKTDKNRKRSKKASKKKGNQKADEEVEIQEGAVKETPQKTGKNKLRLKKKKRREIQERGEEETPQLEETDTILQNGIPEIIENRTPEKVVRTRRPRKKLPNVKNAEE